MQEIIITTLLKFNEIFDAFSQVFTIHNYNCNQQRQILEKCLEKDYISDCVYISLNSNTQIFPTFKDLEQLETTTKQNLQKQETCLIEIIQQNVETETKSFKKAFEDILYQQNEKLIDFKTYANEIFLPKQEIRSFKTNSDERINKLQDQLQQFQTKYALKLYTEQHIIEIKQQIQQMQQINAMIKQDSQTLHKLSRDNRQLLKQHQDTSAKRFENIESELYKISEFEKEISKMYENILEQKSGKKCIKYRNVDNEIMYNKVKSLAQLFQDLEVNNSKVVKFEIHTAFKKVEEELNYFKNRQQSFQDQLQVIKEQMQQSDHLCLQNQQCVNQQFDVITQELVKKKQILKQMQKNITLLQQTEKTQIQSDLPSKVSILCSKVQIIDKTTKLAFEQIKKIIDVFQEFCETSQIPSESKDKDLTNLILLLDRRIFEYGKQLQEPIIQTIQNNSVKINTPRISTSVDSPFVINKQKKSQYKKILNKTVFCDRKETIL